MFNRSAVGHQTTAKRQNSFCASPDLKCRHWKSLSEVQVMSLPASIGSHKLSQIIIFSLVNNS